MARLNFAERILLMKEYHSWLANNPEKDGCKPITVFEFLKDAGYDLSKNCAFPEGVTIKPDGKHELSPCVFREVEKHTNVTVTVSRCRNCGAVDISWERTPETEDIVLEE